MLSKQPPPPLPATLWQRPPPTAVLLRRGPGLYPQPGKGSRCRRSEPDAQAPSPRPGLTVPCWAGTLHPPPRCSLRGMSAQCPAPFPHPQAPRQHPRHPGRTEARAGRAPPLPWNNSKYRDSAPARPPAARGSSAPRTHCNYQGQEANHQGQMLGSLPHCPHARISLALIAAQASQTGPCPQLPASQLSAQPREHPHKQHPPGTVAAGGWGPPMQPLALTHQP